MQGNSPPAHMLVREIRRTVRQFSKNRIDLPEFLKHTERFFHRSPSMHLRAR